MYIVQSSWNPAIAMLLSLLIPGLGQLYRALSGDRPIQLLNGVVWFALVACGYVFFWPGVVLHLFCVIGAGIGNNMRPIYVPDYYLAQPPPVQPPPLPKRKLADGIIEEWAD
jgi:hypothetical protein